MSQTDHTEPIRPGAGLRRLRRGDFDGGPSESSTLLTRAQFRALLIAEIETATKTGSSLLLLRASIRPLPERAGVDLRGRRLPDQLVERISACWEGVRLVSIDATELMMLVPAVRRRGDTDAAIEAVHTTLLEPLVIDDLPHHLGPRIGAAMLDDDNPSVERLEDATRLALDEADVDQPTLVFHPYQRVRSDLKKAMAADLHTAVLAGDITSAVQPIFDVKSGRLVGYDAYARWNRAGKGPVPPDEFVPMAEELEFDHVLQRQVLEHALQTVEALQINEPAIAESDDRPVTMWLNIGPDQLVHPLFSSMILDTMKSLDPGRPTMIGLDLKPTPPSDTIETFQVLEQLASAGVRIAVGDFGIGNANLTTLRRLPFDSVRLDRGLTRQIGLSEAATKVVAALVGLAGLLGLETTGQGIETQEQLDVLRRLGCDLAQGYLLGGPASL